MANQNKKMSIFEKQSMTLAINIDLFMKNYEKAIERVVVALAKSPHDLALLKTAQRVYRDSQNWNSYISANERIEKLFPEDISFKLSFGTTLISLHRYEEALPRLLYCIENWNLDDSYLGTLINTYGRLAICYGYLQNWKLLKNTLQAARNLSPKHIDLDVIYAHLLLCRGTNSSQEIQAFLNEQTTRDPNSYALYFWKGEYTQDYLQDMPGSVELFRAALGKLSYMDMHISQQHYFFAPQQYASSWSVLKRFINTCMQLNKQQEALRQIHTSRMKRAVSHTDLQVLMVYIDILNKSPEIAEAKCTKMLEKKLSVDARTEYSLLIALAQIEQGNFDKALVSINEALTLDSEKLESWKTLGLIQMKTQNWNQAIQTFQTLIGKDYFDFGGWESLGRCYMHIGDHSSATHSYEQAIKLNPLNADAFIDLAHIYVQLGKSDLAIAALQDVIKQEALANNKRQQAIHMLERLM